MAASVDGWARLSSGRGVVFFGARNSGEGGATGCENVGTHFGYSQKIGLARMAELGITFLYLTKGDAPFQPPGWLVVFFYT